MTDNNPIREAAALPDLPLSQHVSHFEALHDALRSRLDSTDPDSAIPDKTAPHDAPPSIAHDTDEDADAYPA
ncbi:MAG: hypothetical protein LBB54_00020 [Cellulomonadaceae bacterium]|jgi:hypothetical protein|nr:hypothetical protein [Cellulomonadaceae bacterium]